MLEASRPSQGEAEARSPRSMWACFYQVNFVVINGDTPQAADMVEKFRVDGIPHFALISKEGEVRTALIGKIPKQVMEADLDALLAGSDLPYEGYDAFEDEDHFVFGRQEVQQGQQL